MNNGHSSLREFGNCRLDIGKKLLWADDRPVPLPLKAVELLCVLVEGRGAVLTKEEIWHEVWNDAFVEETNLTHNIYLLRKALNELGHGGLIETVPRRGYRFSGTVYEVPDNEIVFERRSFTQTVIEAVSDHDEAVTTEDAGQTSRASATRRFRYSTIALLLSFILIVSLAFLAYRDLTSTPDIHSIAVLPLRTISDRPGSEHEGAGLADILITRLSSLKEITVRPTSALLPFENEQLESTEIGRKLRVDAVLEGTIFRSDEGSRVTLRLVRVQDGRTIWSGQFEKPVSDELRLQDDIALKVVDALSLNLNPKERQTLTKHYTDNRDAYEAYLRGRIFFDKRDTTDYQKAISEFEHAIQLDPSYALAYSGLADVYAMQANNDSDHRDGLYQKAKEAVVKALALDDELGEAHTSLAWIKRTHEWDWTGSENEFKRAIELSPNYYNAHMWYSLLLITLGRKEESLAEVEKAKELSPLNSSVLTNYFTVRYFRGDDAELVSIAEQIREIGGDDYRVARPLSMAYLKLANDAKVIETVNEYLNRHGDSNDDFLRSNLAVAYARSGQVERSKQELSRIEQDAEHDSEAAYRLALTYADLGRKDEAISLLQKCFEARDDRLMWIKVEPGFEPLKDDPRFQEIVKKMNLPS